MFITAKIASIFIFKTAVDIHEFTSSQSLIYYLTGLLRIDLMTSSQLWLVTSADTALYRYCKDHGFKSRTGLNFFFRPVTLICTTAQVVFITAKIAFIFRSQLSAVHIYDFHIFTFKHLFIASRVYLEPTYQPAPSWLISSVGRALHWYCRGHGFKSRTGLNFFRPYFHHCSSSVHYCKHCFHIHF